MLFFIGLTACQAQDKASKTTTQKPKGKWQVHREYDEQGNLIKYDSVYVWSSTNLKDFPKNQNLDSLLQSYKTFLNNSDFFQKQPDFSSFENTDSLFNKNFFDDRFFLDNWNNREGKRIQKMLQQMDTIRMRFLQQAFPELSNPEQKEKKI